MTRTFLPRHASAGKVCIRYGRIFSTAYACMLAVAGAMSFAPASSAQCISPPAGLVSWWPGDTNFNDIQGSNNASKESGVQLEPAEVLDGFAFNPSQYSFVYVPQNASLRNHTFTWAAWVEPLGDQVLNNDLDGGKILGQAKDDTDAVIGVNWRSNPDYRFLFLFHNQFTETITSKDTFPPGQFYFVAATYDGETAQLYVNGELEGSLQKRGRVPYVTSVWAFGGSDPKIAKLGYPRTFNGIIDEIQAFNVALGSETLLSIFNAGTAGECKP
jgi:hypothetical protein